MKDRSCLSSKSRFTSAFCFPTTPTTRSRMRLKVPWSHACMRQLGFLQGSKPGRSSNGFHSGWTDQSLLTFFGILRTPLLFCCVNNWRMCKPNENNSGSHHLPMTQWPLSSNLSNVCVVWKTQVAQVARPTRFPRCIECRDAKTQIFFVCDEEGHSWKTFNSTTCPIHLYQSWLIQIYKKLPPSPSAKFFDFLGSSRSCLKRKPIQSLMITRLNSWT